MPTVRVDDVNLYYEKPSVKRKRKQAQARKKRRRALKRSRVDDEE